MRLFDGQLRVTPDKTKQALLTSLTHTGSLTVQMIDKKPFRRRIDAWFFALCLAIKKGLDPVPIENSYNLEYAIVLTDTQQLFVSLIAMQKEGYEIITDPGRMLRLSNELANAGLTELETILNADDIDPIWNLSETMKELLEGDA